MRERGSVALHEHGDAAARVRGLVGGGAGAGPECESGLAAEKKRRLALLDRDAEAGMQRRLEVQLSAMTRRKMDAQDHDDELEDDAKEQKGERRRDVPTHVPYSLRDVGLGCRILP